MAEKKQPAPRKVTNVRSPSKVNTPPTYMRLEGWEGKTWRGQRYRLRVVDTRNGEILLQGEAYLRKEDRDALMMRLADLGLDAISL